VKLIDVLGVAKARFALFAYWCTGVVISLGL